MLTPLDLVVLSWLVVCHAADDIVEIVRPSVLTNLEYVSLFNTDT